MTTEMKAEMIIASVKDALRSRDAPNRRDAKEQIRIILDSDYGMEFKKSELEDLMATCYSGAAVKTRMGIVLFDENGADLNGIIIDWSGLVDCARECLASGTYMSAAEEKSYFEYANATRELLADKLQKLLAENTRESKFTAVMECGSPAWDILIGDPDEFVRGSIAMVGDEQRQFQLIHDPQQTVRQSLADYGTDKVRASLLEKEEEIPILKTIVEKGSAELQAAAIDRFIDDPETLAVICINLKPEAQRALLEVDNPHIAVLGVNEATMKQCQRLAGAPGLNLNERMKIEWRIEELSELTQPAPALQ